MRRQTLHKNSKNKRIKVKGPWFRFIFLAAVLAVLAAAGSVTTGCSSCGKKTNVDTTDGQEVVGSLGGAVSVNSDGSASYTIPIPVPPGTGKMQPKLSISYSSSQSNGLLGVGWEISGLSTVHRIGANIEQDGFKGGINYDENDRFAMDGKRLIVISGSDGADNSQYRTEKESWHWFTAANDGSAGDGPTGFEVLEKGGKTLQYGGTSNSNILAGSGPDVRVWALNSVSDLHGNTMTITYTRIPYSGASDEGQYYPKTIEYTTNSTATTNPIQQTRTVEFIYQQRSDVTVEYIGGSEVVTRGILSNVQTKVNNVIVSDFRLEYETAPVTGRSRLTRITRYNSDSSSAVYLSPTNFGPYQDITAAFDSPGQWLTGSSTVDTFLYPSWTTGSNPRHLVDVNGDGLADLAGFRLGVQVSTSNGGGFDPISQWSSNFGTGWTTATPRMFADVNGDGMADVVGFNFSEVEVAPSDGTKFDESLWSSTPYNYFTSGWSSTQDPRMMADVNGDGLADIVGFKDKTYVGISTGTSFNTPTSWNDSEFTGSSWYTSTGSMRVLADVNGDGMADIVGFSPSGVIVGISTGDRTSAFDTSAWAQNQQGFSYFGLNQDAGGWQINANPRMMADVNGDGKDDIVGFKNGVQVALSTGQGFETPTQWNTGFSMESSPPWSGSYPRFVMDIDGDGMADVLGFGSSGLQAALSDGVSSFSDSWDSSSLSSFLGTNTDYPILVADVTGDGLPDAVSLGAQSGLPQKQVTAGTGSGPYPDLLLTITNGFGGVFTFTYTPMTDTSVYTKIPAPTTGEASAVGYFNMGGVFNYSDYASNYPFRSIDSGNRYLVKKYVESTDSSIQASSYSYEFDLTYSGALVDLLAQRQLGMKTKSVTRKENCQVTTTTYNQEYPLDHTELNETTTCGDCATDPKCSSGDILSVKSNIYKSSVSATGSSGTNPDVYFVYKESNQEDYYDYNTYNFTIFESYVYDSYGNIQQTSYLGYTDQQGNDDSRYNDNYYVCQDFYTGAPTNDIRYRGFSTDRKVSLSQNCSDFSTFTKGTDLNLTQMTYSTDGVMNLLNEKKYDDQSSTFLSWTYGYDDYGNRTSVLNPEGYTTTTEFDTVFSTFPVRQTAPTITGEWTNPVTLETQYAYEADFGSLSAKVDPSGLTTINCVDEFGRLATVQVSAPDITGVQTDTNCLPSNVTGSTASVVTTKNQGWANDGSGGIYQTVTVLQSWPTSTNRDTLEHRKYYDGLSRVYKKYTQGDPSSGDIIVCFNRNDVNNITSRSVKFFGDASANCQYGGDPSVLWQTCTYDVYDRPITATTPAGPTGSETSVTTMAYSNSDKVTATFAANDSYSFQKKMVLGFHNGKKKLLQLIVPGDNNATTTFQYDQLGRATSATDPPTGDNPNGVTTTITYDSLSRRNTVSSPDTGNITYDYKGSEYLKQVTTPNGVNTYTFDPVGRLSTSALADGRTVTYKYDDPDVSYSKQLLTGVTLTDGSSTTSYAYLYDIYGGQTSTTLTMPDNSSYTTVKQFDPLGRVTQLTYPANQGEAVYTYAYGNLDTITLDGDTLADYSSYDPYNNPGNIDYKTSSATEAFTYDPTGHRLTQVVTGSSATLLNFTYSWNHLNHVDSVTDNLNTGSSSLSESYTYENERLKTASGPYGSKTYDYDESGNLTLNNGITYTYDAHRITTGQQNSQTVFSATYDTNGSGAMTEKTADGNSWKYAYNSDNQLTSVKKDDGQGTFNTVYTFGYNYKGKRISSTDANSQAITYVDKYFRVIKDSGSNTTYLKYVYDHDRVVARKQVSSSGSTLLYFHGNTINSTRITTDSSGNLSSSVVYAPYGAIYTTDPSGESFSRKFNGRDYDQDSMLYYYGRRYYDPNIGRFITADSTISTKPRVPDTFNRYAYGLNNPITYIDPSGSQVWSLFRGYTSRISIRSFSSSRSFLSTSSRMYSTSNWGSRGVDSLGSIRNAGWQRSFSSFYRTNIGIEDSPYTSSWNSSIVQNWRGARQFSTSASQEAELPESLEVYNARTSMNIAQSIYENGFNWDMVGAETRFGRAIYVAENETTAIGEVEFHTGENTVQAMLRLRLNLSNAKVLDLTDPEVAAEWGYTGSAGTDYTASQAIAAEARSAGFDAIRFSSLRVEGGVNYAVFNPAEVASGSEVGGAAATAEVGGDAAMATGAAVESTEIIEIIGIAAVL